MHMNMYVLLCSLVWSWLFVVASPSYIRSTSPRKLQRQTSVFQRGLMTKQQSILSEDTLYENVIAEAITSTDEEPLDQSEEGREIAMPLRLSVSRYAFH